MRLGGVKQKIEYTRMEAECLAQRPESRPVIAAAAGHGKASKHGAECED